MGDSNTRDINFESGRGKLGERYPGKRIKAAKIRDINPGLYIGCENILLVCGTNDLRPAEIKDGNYIRGLVKTLEDKVERIKLLNPHAEIFCIPALPTRIPEMS